jgi:hypothetical protein
MATYYTILETPTFTRLVTSAMSDEEYRALQMELARDPMAGDLIRGSGGIRKLRWAAEGRGKRSGFRVIYYSATANQKVVMLYLFAKNEADDLTKQQLRLLGAVVRKEFP